MTPKAIALVPGRSLASIPIAGLVVDSGIFDERGLESRLADAVKPWRNRARNCEGNDMADRSWFVASGGKQEGPYSEPAFRDLIGSGAVTPDTLVWTEGMAAWQRAAEIPGLLRGGSRPPPYPDAGVPQARGGFVASGPLSIDFGILEFVWRSLVLVIGLALVIPGPWALVWYLKWIVPCVRVPSRPNLSFTGAAMTIVPWYFGTIVFFVAIRLIGSDVLNQLLLIVQFVLCWLLLKWVIANLSSDEQPLGLSFSGSIWAYLGWAILSGISVITIIGWAWVYVAWARWFCRNIQGTRREVQFVGSGLEFLWRAIVVVLASIFIIPIPWMYRWMYQWLASQTVLTERGAQMGG
jgi:GYF domain 2